MSLVTTFMQKILIGAFAFVAFVLPSAAFALPADFEVSGWVPYWKAEEGVASAIPQIPQFTEINPFLYTVKQNGEVFQADAITDAEWRQLKAAATAQGVRFIPTVMWGNADAMHEVLSDPEKRQAHIRSIAGQVYRYGFDGIDIDYEAKYAKTRDAFSQFLKELNIAIGYDKWVICTVESRTPLDSRYSSPSSIPDNIEYSNDFTEINKYCDRVRIMAYDQMRIDVKLNEAKSHPYIPVADVDWVRKTINLIAEEVDKDKLVIGVATYGYEYDMIPRDGWTEYSRLWSFNPGYGEDQAAAIGKTPVRNNAGEMMLTYPASQSIDPIIPLPNATRVMVWSDAESIRQKAALAEELGVRGIAIFKIDGGQDPNLWNVLATYSGSKLAQKPLNTTTTNEPVAKAPSAPPTPALDMPVRDLELGSVGGDVETLQKYLNAQGYTVSESGGGAPGNETQYFGPKTKAALARFQAANGIAPAVGYYGPITRRTIGALSTR